MHKVIAVAGLLLTTSLVTLGLVVGSARAEINGAKFSDCLNRGITAAIASAQTLPPAQRGAYLSRAITTNNTVCQAQYLTAGTTTVPTSTSTTSTTTTTTTPPPTTTTTTTTQEPPPGERYTLGPYRASSRIRPNTSTQLDNNRCEDRDRNGVNDLAVGNVTSDIDPSTVTIREIGANASGNWVFEVSGPPGTNFSFTYVLTCEIR